MREKFTISRFFYQIAIFFMLAPYIALSWASFQYQNDFSSFAYLQSAFFRSFGATLALVALTAALSLLWAFPLAYFFAFAKIRYRRLLIAVLCAPLAAPAYLSGFVFAKIFGSSGVSRFFLAEHFDLSFAYWADVKSLPGAALILSACLYPYVFLPLYFHFKSASQSLIDYGLSVGLSRTEAIVKATRSGTATAALAGLIPAMAETLTDYGVSSYFGVRTLTVFLFDVWRQTAESFYIVGVSFLYLFLFSALLGLRFFTAKKKILFSLAKQPKTVSENGLFTPGLRLKIAVLIFAALPFFLGFLLPIAVYGYYVFSDRAIAAFTQDFLPILGNSVTPAALAGICAVGLAAMLGEKTARAGRGGGLLSVFLKSGYALPAVTVGIGVITALTLGDRVLQKIFTFTGGALVTGQIALTYAYSVRFFSIALGQAENAYRKIKPALYESARLAGYTGREIRLKIQFPAIAGVLLASWAFVFAEAIKELPITLLIRPLNFETFATTAYNSASLEQIEPAAAPALAIILIGCAALYLALKIAGLGGKRE